MGVLLLKDNLCLNLYHAKNVCKKETRPVKRICVPRKYFAISPSLKRIEILQIYSRYISLYSVPLLPTLLFTVTFYFILQISRNIAQENTNERKGAFAIFEI